MIKEHKKDNIHERDNKKKKVRFACRLFLLTILVVVVVAIINGSITFDQVRSPCVTFSIRLKRKRRRIRSRNSDCGLSCKPK